MATMTTMNPVSSIQRSRHRPAMPVQLDPPTSRSSKVGSSSNERKKMKTPKSFHSGVAPSVAGVNTQSMSSSNTRKLSRSFLSEKSRSFHSGSRSREVQRLCDVHRDVILSGEGASCPKYSIHLMKLAAATLERRVAEAELELELKGKKKDLEDKAKMERRKERLLKKKNKKPSDEEREGDHRDGIQDLLRWRVDFENKLSAPNRQTKSPPLPWHFSIGQVAHWSQIEKFSSDSTLVKIAMLSKGAGAWVRRSDDVWTYATLKAREPNGSNPSLVFTVNERGSTKKFPMTKWAKWVGLVAVAKDIDDGSGLERERGDEVDTMISDSSPIINKGTKQKLSWGGEQKLEKSLDTFASTTGTASLESLPSEDSSSRGGGREKGEARDLTNHDVSMYTFGCQHSLLEESLAGSADTTISKVSSSDRNVKKNKLVKQLGDNEVSMFTVGLQDEDVSSTSCTSELQQISSYKPKAKDDRKNLRVSFKTPQDTDVTSSQRSSISYISEASSSVDYDADMEIRRNNTTGVGKAEKNVQRSQSLPMPHTQQTRAQHQRQNNKLPRNRPVRRISVYEMEEREGKKNVEMKVYGKRPSNKKAMTNISKAQKKKFINSPNTQKKKLTDLNMGGADKVKSHSFHAALKMIHRRSAVMVPPKSGDAHLD